MAGSCQLVVNSFSQIEKAISRATDAERPIVIKFHAPWCEPCRLIAPWFDEFAEARADTVHFATMNVDQDDDVAVAYGIKTIPAFHVWFRGARVATLGREPEKIKSVVDEYVVRSAAILKNARDTSSDVPLGCRPAKRLSTGAKDQHPLRICIPDADGVIMKKRRPRRHGICERAANDV